MVYLRSPNSGSAEKKKAAEDDDLDKREEKTIADGISDYMISADGKKIMIAKENSYFITDVAADQKLEKKMPANQIEMTIDPREDGARYSTMCGVSSAIFSTTRACMASIGTRCEHNMENLSTVQ